MTALSEVTSAYPQGYRRCPTCQAYIGAPCTAVGREIVAGQVVGGRTELEWPHRARKPRAGW